MDNQQEFNTLPEPVQQGEEKIVVNQIVLRSADRSRKDISDWRKALITAESVYVPNRTRLYDLYSDILLDGYLTGLIEKREDSILNKNLYFEDATGVKVDALDELINHRDFRHLCKLILDAKFWGISGIEFIPGPELQFKPIPRKHIKPKWGIISIEENGIDGFNYLDNPNIWIIGNPVDLGLLLKCAPYALLKRGDLADWAQFIEIFGQPMRVIKYDAYDRQAKVELKQVVDEAGGGMTLLIPNTATIDIVDGKTTNATGALQQELVKTLNDEMSVTILGNTETTGNNNGGSNAKAHEQGKQQLEITKSDIKYLSGILNSKQFTGILQSYGYPVSGGKFTFEQEIDMSKVTQQMTVAQQAKAMGVPIDDEYIYDLTGIPKPDNYDELKAETQQRVAEQNNGGEQNKQQEDADAENNDNLSDSVWNKIRLKLADFFDPAP